MDTEAVVAQLAAQVGEAPERWQEALERAEYESGGEPQVTAILAYLAQLPEGDRIAALTPDSSNYGDLLSWIRAGWFEQAEQSYSSNPEQEGPERDGPSSDAGDEVYEYAGESDMSRWGGDQSGETTQPALQYAAAVPDTVDLVLGEQEDEGVADANDLFDELTNEDIQALVDAGIFVIEEYSSSADQGSSR